MESIKLHRKEESPAIKVENYEDSLVIDNMYNIKAYDLHQNEGQKIVNTIVKNKALKDKKLRK